MSIPIQFKTKMEVRNS